MIGLDIHAARRAPLVNCVQRGAEFVRTGAVSLGSDLYYTPTEIQGILVDLKADLSAIMAATTAVNDKLTPSERDGVRAFVAEAGRYIEQFSLSSFDAGLKDAGDALVKYRERARDWAQLLSSKGAAVRLPAPPVQRRAGDPRDIAEAEEKKRREAEEWSWKQYLLAFGLGAVGVGTVGYIVVGLLRGRA